MLWSRVSSGVQTLTYLENLLTLTPRAEDPWKSLRSLLFPIRPSICSLTAPWLFAEPQKGCGEGGFLN